MSNYCLQARFHPDLERQLAALQAQIAKEFPDSIDGPPKGEVPHLTIFYGPQLAPGAEEIKVHNPELDRLFAGAFTRFKGLKPILEYRGVSHFEDHPQIVKLEFRDDAKDVRSLTALRVFLRDEIPGEKKRHEDLAQKNPVTYGPLPKRWIHQTVAVLKKNVSPSVQLQIEERIRNLVETQVQLPSSVPVHSVEVLSAVTDTPIPLW